MTWGAFLAAMRNGVAHRAGNAGKRGPQVVNQSTKSGSTRSSSSQLQAGNEEAARSSKKAFAMEDWDFMLIDVCFSSRM